MRRSRLIAALLLCPLFTACQQIKSENPLSPSIAGPIEGVEISDPKALEPTNGFSIVDTAQPVTLLIENPSSNSPRPYGITVQVAADAQFASVAVTQNGLQPGPNGRTSWRLPDRLPGGRTYFWRARADDGANRSAWSNVATFAIVFPVILGTPVPMAPIANARVTSSTPQFQVQNGVSTGPFGALRYQFQIADNAAFAPVWGNAEVAQGNGTTSYTTPTLPAPDRVFYWRARILDPANVGPWSRVETFRSPVATTPPTPPPGTGGSCASTDGNTIVTCISAKYPQYLVAGVSLSTRQANMMFLRDRIIEAGRCGGLDLGWNLKRGGPEISIDFIAQRQGGTVLGIDIGLDYDNTSQPLRLYWGHGEFPTYGGYTNSYSCN
jgi:hypothetical protein